ncbi:hypothetical protein ES288_D07G174900v1 [Gossypium darwinii]|uniref:Uncharacterized protein n=1 Tax=Gossypium darwinii TaxID=34276 RepID=A0A5D2BWQ3_GOSDA|nr:hypothetical protein ES288_D07G174900v1 [Gossypium darwinii]
MLPLSFFCFFLLACGFCRFAPSRSTLPLSFFCFLQHNLRLAFSTFSFLFLFVTLSLALIWWVSKFTATERYWTVSYRFAPDINRWQTEALVAIQEIIMSGVPESNASSQASR